jgi:transposase
VFAGVLHVLRTGCPWKEVPAELGPGSTLHRYFERWEQAGVFQRLWRHGLAEAPELEGVAWRWKDVPSSSASSTGKGIGPGGSGKGTAPVERIWVPALERRRRRRDGDPMME